MGAKWTKSYPTVQTPDLEVKSPNKVLQKIFSFVHVSHTFSQLLTGSVGPEIINYIHSQKEKYAEWAFSSRKEEREDL